MLIPSYIRPDDLKVTLEKTALQNYPDFEIVVIDDGTPGDSILDVCRQFPMVSYVRTPHNLGLIGARNFGSACCLGEYILNLDDDSWLEENNGLAQIVDIMENNPQIGVLALNIKAHGQLLWPSDAQSQPIRTYKGCGNVYRAAILPIIGPYVSEFRRQGEEVERSLRIYDAGYEVRSAPSICAVHMHSSINRNMPKHVAMEAVNYLRREVLRAPLWLLPIGLGRAVRYAILNRKHMDVALYFEELLGTRAPLLSLVRKYRTPVKTSTYFHSLRLR